LGEIPEWQIPCHVEREIDGGTGGNASTIQRTDELIGAGGTKVFRE
jgi:hypothetical protein